MVNKVKRMRARVVKIEVAGEKERRATSKGGLALAQAVARHLRLWSEARRELPRRKDPRQGYETSGVVASLVHGLLSGGRGFCATEPMRGDRPLLRVLGLDQAPSAETVEELVSASKLGKHVSVLLDSLYGDGTTLDMLERLNSKPSYIVGAQGLREAQRVMSELPEAVWRDTGREESRGWSESGAATAWLSCAGWKRKRQMICRRWKNEGEMIWNYAAVVTNLCEEDRRVRRVMERYDIGFEEAIWFLYSKKQGMENQWKDLLKDMGLHHPRCAKAQVNALFYAIAGLAYTLSVAVRTLTLEGASRRMRLWRLRREVIDVAGYVVQHGRYLVMRLLDARDHLIEQILSAMQRLARL